MRKLVKFSVYFNDASIYISVQLCFGAFSQTVLRVAWFTVDLTGSTVIIQQVLNYSAVLHGCFRKGASALSSSGGSRKKYLGAWPLIIWEASTPKRNLL